MSLHLPDRALPAAQPFPLTDPIKLLTLLFHQAAAGLHVSGDSGTGKSVALAGICAALASHVPFLLIDPHGDLSRLVYRLCLTMGPSVSNRVVYVRHADTDRITVLNPLALPQDRSDPLRWSGHLTSKVEHFIGILLSAWGEKDLNSRPVLFKNLYRIFTTLAAARLPVAAARLFLDTEDPIYHAMLKAGSEWPAMAPFVATGWRGAVGHMTWEHRVLEEQDYVFLEVAGCYNRYHTAMMRTVTIGDTPPAISDGEKVCLDAMQATMETIKPGVPASEIDVLARDIIEKGAPHVEQAARTAYSIGTGFPPDWGEGHILSMVNGHDRPLEKNMTFHLIPWIQVPGHGGVGITETIVVTEDGCRSLFDFEQKVFSA